MCVFGLWLVINSSSFLFFGFFLREKPVKIKTTVQHYSSQILRMPSLSWFNITRGQRNAKQESIINLSSIFSSGSERERERGRQPVCARCSQPAASLLKLSSDV